MRWVPCLLLFSTAANVHADSELRQASLVDQEVAAVVEASRELFMEAWEEAGDFGHGGSAMEASQTALDLGALADRAADRLAAGVEAQARSALLAFLASSAGEKYAWLRRELATDGGQKYFVRHGRVVQDRLPPERLVVLESVDEALGASALQRTVARRMVELVGLGAAQIAGLTGEVAEWDDPEAEVSARLQDLAAQRTFLRLSYGLNRMDAGELDALLAWAESPGGRAFHAARQDALLAVVSEVADRFVAAQQSALDEELAEYRREEDEDDENEDEDGP